MFVSKDRRSRCTLRNHFSVPLIVKKAPETSPKLHAQGHSGPQRSEKFHQASDVEGPPVRKDTFFFDFGGRLVDRWCSYSLALFPPPFAFVKETWQNVLTVYTSQKQAEKAHVVYEQCPKPSKCMQPGLIMHAANVSLHHLYVHVDRHKSLGW